MMYHFLVESKPHEKIDLLITASAIKQKNKKRTIPTVMKTCFSEGKLMKQFGPSPPLLSKRTSLFNGPPISEQFFMTPLFVQILKMRNPPKFCRGGNYVS